jgi:hypothetical protein
VNYNDNDKHNTIYVNSDGVGVGEALCGEEEEEPRIIN